MRPDDVRQMRFARIAGHSFLSAPLTADSVVVDLGVNHGEFALSVIEDFGCRVVGVEPVPALFEALPSHDRLTVDRRAITREGHPATLYVNRSTCATILEPLSQADASSVDVDGITLEGLLDRHRLDRAPLVKVDIEGAEIPMLEAATLDTLRRVDQFTIEFHDFLDPALAGQVEVVKRRLRSAGFGELALSRDNSDVLFVNTAQIPFGAGRRAAAAVCHKYPRGVRRILARQLPVRI
jgi:FkbM family methyltransferase